VRNASAFLTEFSGNRLNIALKKNKKMKFRFISAKKMIKQEEGAQFRKCA